MPGCLFDCDANRPGRAIYLGGKLFGSNGVTMCGVCSHARDGARDWRFCAPANGLTRVRT